MGVKVGCCGFPGGMGRYFRGFKLAEVQQTFYKPPHPETAARWRERAGPDFGFTIKAWQLITHPPSSPTYRRAGLSIPREKVGRYGFFRPTPEVLEAWQTTKEIARALKAQVVLFQCPASFTPAPEHQENLRSFFSAIGREFRWVWEPRGEWGEEVVSRLCRELGLVHGVDPFLAHPLSPGVKYFRLHGGPGYRHRYSDEELRALRGMVGEGEAYVLFNNLSMAEDAHRFLGILENPLS